MRLSNFHQLWKKNFSHSHNRLCTRKMCEVKAYSELQVRVDSLSKFYKEKSENINNISNLFEKLHGSGVRKSYKYSNHHLQVFLTLMVWVHNRNRGEDFSMFSKIRPGQISCLVSSIFILSWVFSYNPSEFLFRASKSFGELLQQKEFFVVS